MSAPTLPCVVVEIVILSEQDGHRVALRSNGHIFSQTGPMPDMDTAILIAREIERRARALIEGEDMTQASEQ